MLYDAQQLTKIPVCLSFPVNDTVGKGQDVLYYKSFLHMSVFTICKFNSL